LTRTERIALLDKNTHRSLAVSIQAELLNLNRSGLYYKPKPVTEAELELRKRIDEIYTKWPFYGSRRITAVLNREGRLVKRKAVQGLMRKLGIAGICPGP